MASNDDPLAGYVEPLVSAAYAAGMSDQALANLLGVSRSTVNLWRNERQPERLDGRQRANLADALRARIALIHETLSRIEHVQP